MMFRNAPVRSALALSVLTAALLTASHSASAAVVLVDNFTSAGSSPSFTLANNVTTDTQTQTGLGTVVGGSRTITLTAPTAPVGTPDLGTQVSTDMTTGFFDYFSPESRDGTVSLGYDLSSLGIASLTGVTINFEAYDVPSPALPLNLSFTATYTGSGAQTSVIVPYTTTGASTVTIPSTGLTQTGTLSNLTVSFDPPAGGDFTISSVSVNIVPEPSALAAVFPVALLAVRRRR